MIGIAAIGCYVPERRLSNLERLDQFNVTPEFIATKLGFRAVARKAQLDETSDLCVQAVANLRAELQRLGRSGAIDDCECVIVCGQNPDGGGLPHTSAIVHDKLGLPPACACFDVSLGCSGYVHSLGIATAFMQANDMSNGLLLTADPYSKIVDPNDRNTAMIFGDGATATWLATAGADEAMLVPTRSRHHIESGRHAALQNRDGTLHMDGRAIFNFSASSVPIEIDGLLASAGLGKDEIDLYVLHQGSKYVVDAIRLRLGVDEARAPMALTECGNTVSSSIPMVLQPVVNDDRFRKIVLCGFGVGLAVATCLLERQT